MLTKFKGSLGANDIEKMSVWQINNKLKITEIDLDFWEVISPQLKSGKIDGNMFINFMQGKVNLVPALRKLFTIVDPRQVHDKQIEDVIEEHAGPPVQNQMGYCDRNTPELREHLKELG